MDLFWGKFVGLDLAGRSDPGLLHGMFWGTLAAVFEAMPWMVLVLVFATVLGEGPAVGWLTVAVLLVVAFVGVWLCKANALLVNYRATYGLVADMRFAAADRLSRLPLGSVIRSRGATLADLFTDRFTLYQDVVTHMWWQVSTALRSSCRRFSLPSTGGSA